MEVALVVLTGASAGDRFNFRLTEEGAVIGRLPECDLVLQDTLVSRKHAKLFVRNDEPMLADMGSSGGTIHMGFRLEPGDDNARKLSPGDEFKLGGTVFRAEFEEIVPGAPEAEAKEGTPRKKLAKNQRLMLFAALALVVAVAGFILTGGDDSEMPAQRSNEKILLPDKKAYGFVPGADRAHADKVQFQLPTSDNVFEYDFLSNGTTVVYVDQAKVETLPKTDGSWVQHMMLIRDPKGGQERVLVFDEEAIKTGPEGLVGPLRPWGVRNVRYSSLPLDENTSADDLIRGAIGLTETMGRSNDSLFRLSRSLSKAGLALLRESGLESQGITIDSESPRPDTELIKIKLESILSERQASSAGDSTGAHLKAITDLVGQCEAELWRKFGVETRQAVNRAKAKEFIEAHDQLLGVQTMIGDPDDYRFRRAGELLDDKKIIPPRIRKDPGKYRKTYND